MMREGEVFTRTDWSGKVNQTFLCCGRQLNDPITGDRLDEPVFTFIVWQGDVVFRSKKTEAETGDLSLSEQGLSRQQLKSLARMAFNNWEQNEYRRMGVLKP